jgi:DNA repair ATPase RecN
MYAQYFGDNGEVRQALNEANRDLSNAHALLTSAQNDLQALTNGEITPESLHEISNTVNGLKTMWGIQGTYVNDENTIANKVLDYVDIAIGKKNFEMTDINGET